MKQLAALVLAAFMVGAVIGSDDALANYADSNYAYDP